MRVRITRQPHGTIDGIDLSRFHVGFVYEVGYHVASVLLAEGWAIPSEDDAPPAFVRPTGTSAPGPNIDRTVLVADDDESTRNLVAAALTHVGFQVVTARNGREALKSLQRDHPDVVVLDLMMPGMDGWQFRREQQRMGGESARVPVVLLTGVEGADEQGRRLSVADVVMKPFIASDLVAAVRRIWRRRPALS